MAGLPSCGATLEVAGLPSCGATKRPAFSTLSHVPTCGRISPASHHLRGQAQPNQLLRDYCEISECDWVAALPVASQATLPTPQHRTSCSAEVRSVCGSCSRWAPGEGVGLGLWMG